MNLRIKDASYYSALSKGESCGELEVKRLPSIDLDEDAVVDIVNAVTQGEFGKDAIRDALSDVLKSQGGGTLRDALESMLASMKIVRSELEKAIALARRAEVEIAFEAGYGRQ